MRSNGCELLQQPHTCEIRPLALCSEPIVGSAVTVNASGFEAAITEPRKSSVDACPWLTALMCLEDWAATAVRLDESIE
jgi:hypothetical protein